MFGVNWICGELCVKKWSSGSSSILFQDNDKYGDLIAVMVIIHLTLVPKQFNFHFKKGRSFDVLWCTLFYCIKQDVFTNNYYEPILLIPKDIVQAPFEIIANLKLWVWDYYTQYTKGHAATVYLYRGSWNCVFVHCNVQTHSKLSLYKLINHSPHLSSQSVFWSQIKYFLLTNVFHIVKSKNITQNNTYGTCNNYISIQLASCTDMYTIHSAHYYYIHLDRK